MPWTKHDYPDSLGNLSEPVRAKAIEIANSLVEKQGYADAKAIAIATSQAKQWAARRGIEIASDDPGNDPGNGPTPAKPPEIHVVPTDDGWTLRGGDTKAGGHHYATQAEAISQARADARAANTDVVIHAADGKIRDRISLHRLDGGPTYHVRARDDAWIVIEEGAERAVRVFDDKAAAVEAGRELASHQHGELVIHTHDGAVQRAHNYSEKPARQ